jgi:HNH endonuclease
VSAPAAKRCPRCERELPLEAFSRRRSSRDGLEHNCRECRRGSYEANRGRILEQKRAYREAHRKLEHERNRAYREANRKREHERNRAYREANRESILEQKRAYYEANRGRILEQKRTYYEAHRERELEQRRARHKAHRERELEHKRAYAASADGLARSAARRSPLGSAAIVERFTFEELRERDRELCRLCGRPVIDGGPRSLAPSIDHVIPLRAGGLHALANVRLAHVGCNVAHGVRWTVRLRRLEALRAARAPSSAETDRPA